MVFANLKLNQIKKIYLNLLVILFLFANYSNAQELFHIDKGQFIEQVYGGSLLEEGKDMIDYNNNLVMAGWIEQQYEEETTSVDASLWLISNIGEQLLHKSYGHLEFAEIAEAATTNNDYIYLAIRETQNSSMNKNVSLNDSLIILALDSDGVIVWTFKTGIEEGGIAPKDIIIDSDGNLSVLANSITSSDLEGSLIIKVSLGGTLLMQSDVFYGSSEQGATSYELVEYENGFYYTICNDLGYKHPISVRFDMYNSNNVSTTDHSTLEDIYLFGFAYTLSNKVFAAGFSVTNKDTDAVVVQIDSALGIAGLKRHGLKGTEKLNDIGETTDGFIAGGIANNQGEGGWDNYILHFNSTATSVTLTETMGSEENETSNHMRINKADPKAYFPGMTLGFEERFGNASVMGTLSHPQGPVGANCDYPRVAYVDGLLNLTNGIVTGSTSLLSNKNAIINMAHTYNVDYVILYEIDRLFDQWKDSGYHPYDQASITNYTYPDKPVLQAMNHLVTMLLEANKSPNGIVFGIAIGGSQDFIINNIDAMDLIFNSMSIFNAHNAGKITMAVLEWETWNLPGGEFLLKSVSDENSFRNSARVQAIYPNFPVYNPAAPTQFYTEVVNPNNGLNPSEKQELASAYYFKLSELRIDYLKQFKAERNKNANLKASMDYIGHLSSNTPAVTTFYSSYNENISSAAAGTVIVEQQFRDNMAASLLKTADADVDAILLANYFDPGTASVINYNLGASGYKTEDYEALASVPGVDFNCIPLFSAEMTNGCVYDQGFFGNWLGGSKTPAYAESQFTDQLWSTYGALWGSSRPNCPTCFSKTKVKGFGWYTLNCLDNNQKNHQGTFTNFGLSNCNGTGSYTINLNDNFENSKATIFPNPAAESFQLDLGINYNGEEFPFINIYDLNGRNVYSRQITENQTEIKIHTLATGAYIVRVNNQAFKLIKT